MAGLVRVQRACARWSPWAAVAVAAVFFVSCRLTLHWQPRTGMVISLERGCLRCYGWNTSLWNIFYPPGLSCEDNSWGVDWSGSAHFGGPSVARGPGPGQYLLAIPLWTVAGVLGVVAVVARARGWGRQPGQCRKCGYDLKGLDVSSKCPECGAIR